MESGQIGSEGGAHDLLLIVLRGPVAAMYSGQLVFAQIMECVPHWEFQRLVRRYGQASARLKFSPWEHLLAMCFAQLTFRESLRDIVACLGHRSALAYHLGFRSRVNRSTLSYANEHRDWRLFAALAQRLMQRARKLYEDEPGILDLAAKVYALDASVIDLSLALCPWANWTGTDAAVKLHTLLDLRGPLPAFVAVTAAEQGEVTLLDELPIEAGSYYIMDRGYVDLRRLRRLSDAGASSSSASVPAFAITSPVPARWIAPPRCVAIRPFVSMVGTRGVSGPAPFAAWASLMLQDPGDWPFGPTNGPCPLQRWPRSIASAGKSNFSFAGSNRTCACASSTAPRPMRCASKSGRHFAPTWQ